MYGLNRGQRAGQTKDETLIRRPDLTYDTAGISRWLLHHHDGGWLQTSQHERDETAHRLMFLSWLMARGEVSDDC